jgi:hypothetical protein
MEACATLGVKVTDKGMTIIDEYHLYSVSPRKLAPSSLADR